MISIGDYTKTKTGHRYMNAWECYPNYKTEDYFKDFGFRGDMAFTDSEIHVTHHNPMPTQEPKPEVKTKKELEKETIDAQIRSILHSLEIGRKNLEKAGLKTKMKKITAFGFNGFKTGGNWVKTGIINLFKWFTY